MARGRGYALLLGALEVAFEAVVSQPASPERDAILTEAEAIRQTINGWANTPPSAAERESVAKRALSVQLAALQLRRSDP